MTIEKIFKAFKKARILVVGDIMIDRYLTGNVERVSPEAPVPVVQLNAREDRLGGAANVALNIKALGAEPILCSVVGKDKNAEQIFQLLPRHQLESTGIVQSESRKTTVKTRVIAQSQHLLRVDEEDTHDLDSTETESFLSNIKEILESSKIDAILFQDYNKGVLSPKVIRALLLEAIKRDIPTAVDPKYKNFWLFKHATLFKPNLKEITNQANFPITAELSSLRKATKMIRNKLGNVNTLITLSDKGIFMDGDGKSQVIPTQPRTIADVCGAGDTVISVAALGLAIELPMPEIAVLANLAGGQVCEKVGVVPVDSQQLIREYSSLKKVGKH